MVVLDAKKDWRLAENPLVTGWPYIRFYAGAPVSPPFYLVGLEVDCRLLRQRDMRLGLFVLSIRIRVSRLMSISVAS